MKPIKMSKNFKKYFENHPSNKDEDKNMNSFSKALSGNKSQKEKTSTATNNADSVVVGSDAENNVVIIHSTVVKPRGKYPATR